MIEIKPNAMRATGDKHINVAEIKTEERLLYIGILSPKRGRLVNVSVILVCSFEKTPSLCEIAK